MNFVVYSTRSKTPCAHILRSILVEIQLTDPRGVDVRLDLEGVADDVVGLLVLLPAQQGPGRGVMSLSINYCHCCRT